MGTFDLYSPFMSASILMDPDDPSSRVPLWSDLEGWVERGNASPAVRGLLSRDIYALSYVSELSVELQLAYLPIISVTLTPPYRDAIAFLDSPLIEWGRSVLEVRFGYTGGAPEGAVLSPPFSGLILKPDVTLAEDCTIVLKAQGVGGFGLPRQQQLKQYDGKTRREVIEDLIRGPDKANPRACTLDFSGIQASLDSRSLARSEASAVSEVQMGSLASQYNYDVNTIRANTKLSKKEKAKQEERALQTYKAAVANTEAKLATRFSAATHPIDAIVPSVSQAGLTDQMLIWKLVREAGCWMRWVGDTLFIFDKSLATTQEPKYIFRYYDMPAGEIGPANGVFPILSCSSPTPAIYLPAEVRGFVLKGIDPETREERKTVVTDKTDPSARTGDAATTPGASKQLPGADEKTGDGLAMASQDTQLSGDQQFKAMLKAEGENATASMMGVKLEIETFGVPDLLPGDVVAVRGIGQRLASGSGNFGVQKVTHTVGSSGYLCRCDVLSNVGELSTKLNQLLLPTGPVNTAKPQDPPAGSVGQTRGKTVKPKKGS